DAFPEGGIERLDLLLKQRRTLLAERSKNEAEAEARRLRRMQMHVDRDDCAKRAQVIEALRSLAPQVDAARRVYAAGLERRDAVAQEKLALTAGLGNLVPPSSLAFFLF